mmetsp:Transcript_12692/g.30221  ORF Transcript_12692/g.30221 Transcript_12692/m.30221 type:complete len:204 (+) Transcript_12692:143-754(+)
MVQRPGWGGGCRGSCSSTWMWNAGATRPPHRGRALGRCARRLHSNTASGYRAFRASPGCLRLWKHSAWQGGVGSPDVGRPRTLGPEPGAPQGCSGRWTGALPAGSDRLLRAVTRRSTDSPCSVSHAAAGCGAPGPRPRRAACALEASAAGRRQRRSATRNAAAAGNGSSSKLGPSRALASTASCPTSRRCKSLLPAWGRYRIR